MKAIAALALLQAACAGGSPPPRQDASQRMETFSMTHTEGGRPIWRLESPEAVLEGDGQARLSLPKIDFYRAGRLASVASAKRARLRGRDVWLEEEVVVRRLEDKSVLHTERLEYQSRSGRFRTEEPVLIERPDSRIRGRGLEANSDLSDIRIFHQETELQ